MSKLFAKLALVQSQLKSIPEKGRNAFHNYKYATAEDIINAVRPICSEHGLFISISCTEHQILKDGKAASVIVTLAITDAETGEVTTCTMPGYAEDPKSDKSLWKAITSASKYSIRSFFCLASTDDAECEDEQPERIQHKFAATVAKPPTNNSGQQGVLIEQTTSELKRLGWSNERGKLYLQDKFGKTKRSELTIEELQEFLSALKLMQPSVSVGAQ